MDAFTAYPGYTNLLLDILQEERRPIQPFILKEGGFVSLFQVIDELIDGLDPSRNEEDGTNWANLQQALIHLYGLRGESAKGPTAIGRMLEVSNERPKQLRGKALLKLRQPEHLLRLREFLIPSDEAAEVRSLRAENTRLTEELQTATQGREAAEQRFRAQEESLQAVRQLLSPRDEPGGE